MQLGLGRYRKPKLELDRAIDRRQSGRGGTKNKLLIKIRRVNVTSRAAKFEYWSVDKSGAWMAAGLDHAVNPPSITMVCPEMKAAAGDIRNTIAPTTSSTRPGRPKGVRLTICARCLALIVAVSSVSM